MEHVFLTTSLVLLLLMYVMSGIHKMQNLDATSKSLAGKTPNLKMHNIFVYFAVLIELACPVLILLHVHQPKLISQEIAVASFICLIVFTILATLLYHPFRMNASYMQNIPFFSNLTALGGLMLGVQHFY